MANKHKGEVEIVLDKPRTLKYNFNALAELEDQLGQSLSSLSEETPGIRTLIKMVWAGLIHEEPSLTINEVTELLDYSDIETVSETVSLAFENTFSKDTKKNMSKTKMKKQS